MDLESGNASNARPVAVPLFGKFPLRAFDDFGQVNIHGLRNA